METRPPRTPLQTALTSQVLEPNSLSSTTTVRPQVAADSVVLTTHRAAVWALPGEAMPSVEPGLKPYQPSHRMKVPSTCSMSVHTYNELPSSQGKKRPVWSVLQKARRT